MNAYTPVPCAVYARYELAIIRRQVIMLGWRAEAGLFRLARVRPVDLQTCSGEEFLVLRTAQDGLERVRLDRIITFSQAASGARDPP